MARSDPSPWPGRVAVVAVFLLLGVLSVRQVGSLDAGFHLKAGEYVLEGNGWPQNDPFSYTMGDHRYLDTTWGYQVVVALVHRAAGVAGLTLLHAALVLVTFGLVYRTIRLGPARRETAAAVLLLGGLASELRFQARPELLSYALLAWVLYLLHRRAAGHRTPLWLLPPTFLLWVNVHGLFVLGWGAIACFVVGSWLGERNLDRPLIGASAVAALAGLVNPYGWRALTFPLTLVTRLREDNVFGESIGEFVSPFALDLSEQFPFFPRVAIYSFYALVALVLLSLLPLIWRRRFVSVLLALPFLWLSATAVRNIPPLAVACLPGIVWGFPITALRDGERVGSRLRAAIAFAVISICLVTAPRVVHDAYYLANRRVDRFGLDWNRTALPVAAVEYANRAGLRGRVLNYLSFGGYLMWARPEPVFIDGRLEVVGERFYESYRSALATESALEATVARHGIEWIFFPYKTTPQLLRRLARDRRWRLAYLDHLAVIFVRAGTPADVVLDPSVVRAVAPPEDLRFERLPGLGGRPREAGVRRWLAGLVRRERFASDSFGRGLFHYFLGDPARAAPLFARGIEDSGGAYYEMYSNLGSSMFRLARYAEARECYRVVLEERPQNELARRRLAEIERLLN